MAINVNPPPLLKIPRKFLEDREIRAFFEQQNIIIFQLWNRSGGATDVTSETADSVTVINEEITVIEGDITKITNVVIESEATAFPNPVLLQQLRLEIKGLPELTIDTTGFTTDLTTITTDKVIA